MLLEIQAIGVPSNLLPSADPMGEQVQVGLERGRRVYSLYFEDRGFQTILCASTAREFLEQVFRYATSRMAGLTLGPPPGAAAFKTWAEHLSRVRPEWGERLRRSEGELRGLPGWRKL